MKIFHQLIKCLLLIGKEEKAQLSLIKNGRPFRIDQAKPKMPFVGKLTFATNASLKKLYFCLLESPSHYTMAVFIC